MKEIAEADDAARAVENLGKRVLEEYRRKHTKEELQEDKSILAHLIRRCVVTCQHTDCSVLFCSVLFCSVLFCSVLFCSVLFCSTLLEF